jgi:hypothetical protein
LAQAFGRIVGAVGTLLYPVNGFHN